MRNNSKFKILEKIFKVENKKNINKFLKIEFSNLKNNSLNLFKLFHFSCSLFIILNRRHHRWFKSIFHF